MVTAANGRLVLKQVSHEAPPIIQAPTTGVGRLRKVALIGSAKTVYHAPWHDPTWEIWAHATVHHYCQRVDRYFDLHPWDWISEKPVPDDLEWLKKLKTPIYMQRVFAHVPSSVRFPRERVMAEYPRYFTSHAAWMIALALSEGVTHLGFYGIHYAIDEEHKKQRAGCEYWMGVAQGKGVQLVIPEGCPLLKEPAWLYGYESHTGKRHIREETGGKKPGMEAPPQNLPLTEMANPTVEKIRAMGRADGPFSESRLEAMLTGKAPLLPSGQPAW
jgi:hypothetical protein